MIQLHRSSVLTLSTVSMLAAAACGGDDGPSVRPDAMVVTTADAAIDAPPLPPGCDYAELRDVTNDDYFAMGTPEPTGLSLATSLVVCGKIDNTHFDASGGLVDVDGFTFTLASESDLLVNLSGAGVEALAEVYVEMWTGANFATRAGSSLFRGDHAVFIRRVPAGTYELVMLAFHGSAPSAAIDYKIQVLVDNPTTRCGAKTEPDYTEADPSDNDVIDISNTIAETPSTTDAPEPTNLTIAPATSYMIAGTFEDSELTGGYFGRDTFSIQTGAATNQLSIRLNWTSTTLDADFVLFANDSFDMAGSGFRFGLVEDEFATFPVMPNTTYRLWVGAYEDSTNLPSPYAATICGATFTAP
jgi:hypothetical protein